MSARRLGVFGGSFNPPHVGHLAVAEAAAQAAGLDEVLWMPAATPPHKRDDPSLASADDRLAMVRLATQGNTRFRVSDAEVRRDGVSYTVDTLRELHGEIPDAHWHLLIGGDSLDAFASWREPDAIVGLARLIVYARPGASGQVPEGLAPFVDRVEGPLLDLSSTQLRQRIAAGRTVRYLVPDAVRDYITRHGLYASGAGRP